MAADKHDPQELFFSLGLDDVGHAARLLRPAYEDSQGTDGTDPTWRKRNVTLLFSVDRYEQVMDAYVDGLPSGGPAARRALTAG